MDPLLLDVSTGPWISGLHYLVGESACMKEPTVWLGGPSPSTKISKPLIKTSFPPPCERIGLMSGILPQPCTLFLTVTLLSGYVLSLVKMDVIY